LALRPAACRHAALPERFHSSNVAGAARPHMLRHDGTGGAAMLEVKPLGSAGVRHAAGRSAKMPPAPSSPTAVTAARRRYSSPYCLSFRYSVRSLSPIDFAAFWRLPPDSSSDTRMWFFSTSSTLRPARNCQLSWSPAAARGSRRQIAAGEDVAARGARPSTRSSLELAHVARPVVLHERDQRLAVDRLDVLAVQLREVPEVVVDQQLDVAAAVAQRRQLDG